jgi:hypothetical protein
LLLVAFCRQSGDESFAPADMQASKFLRFVTKAAVILYGIWVAFNLFRVVVTPFTHALLQRLALKGGRTPPPLSRMMLDVIQMVLTQACLFIAPYVVYNSWLRRTDTPGEMRPVPTESAFPAQAETPLGGDDL